MGTSRSMERGFRDLAEMLKFLVIQYMPVRTLIDYLGTDGIPATVFDYSPDMVIPSHMPGEQTVDPMGQPVASSVETLTRAKTCLLYTSLSLPPLSFSCSDAFAAAR